LGPIPNPQYPKPKTQTPIPNYKIFKFLLIFNLKIKIIKNLKKKINC